MSHLIEGSSRVAPAVPLKFTRKEPENGVITGKKLLKLTEELLSAIEPIRKFTGTAEQDLLKDLRLFEKVVFALTNSQPISFILPAFPCKSPNLRDKVLGTLPDRGEELAINTLCEFAKTVDRLSPTGCKMLIISDGRVFADLLGVNDSTVLAYQKANKAMTASPLLSWLGLEDFFPDLPSKAMREGLIGNFSKSAEETKANISSDNRVRELYTGLTRFMTEDLRANGFSSGNQLKKAAKKLALEMLRRSQAYSSLIEERFPMHLRLSIHPQSFDPDKIGINLIGSGKWGTPWHNVVLEDEQGDLRLVKRAAAEALGAKLIFKDGRPWCFKL